MATAQTSYNSKEAVCADENKISDETLNENVKIWKQGKYRDFLLTLNCEIDDNIDKSKIELLKKFNNLITYLLSLKYSYILASLEKNKHNFYHIHIFIQFNNPHSLSIKKLEGAHINIINKTINKVLDYVQKDGVILKEFGYPRYITGNPSIKDISLSRFSEINENSNAKYYRIYKEIKQDNQGLFNTPKTIYIKQNLPRTTEFKDFNFLQINNKGKIKKWPSFMILKDKQITLNNIDILLSQFNEPLQYKFYPADIEKILFIIPENNIHNNKLIEYINNKCNEKHILNENDISIKFTLINDYNKPELDSDEEFNSSDEEILY